MAASYRRSTATRNAIANTEGDLLDGGSIQFRSGPQPTNVGDAAGGTLGGTVLMNPTAFGAAASGVVTANPITSDTNADNSCTVAHARLLDSGAAIHSDANCGTGTESFVFDNNVIVAGGTIAVSTLAITVPI